MKIHLVCYEDLKGWILGKFATKLQENLLTLGVDVSVSKTPDPESDINYHIIYFDYSGRKSGNSIDTVMATHLDNQWKIDKVLKQLETAALAICMSKQTVQQLINAGAPPKKVTFVNPAHDGEISPRQINIGITSKVQGSGCKREGLLLELCKNISPLVFRFTIMGPGWESIVHQMRSLGFWVDYYDNFMPNVYKNIIPEFDYYLYLGMDEGSMGYLDALAAGIPTIVTPQGYHLDMGIMDYSFTTLDDLLDVFSCIVAKINQRTDSVAKHTWLEYAKSHLLLWEQLGG